MSGGGRKPVGDDAEVEALLRAAQDAVLLKLQANSHLVSSSSSAASNPLALDEGPGPLDDDLARRLDALRSRPAAPKRPGAAPAPAAGGMDEMEVRFAALKGAAVCPEKETRVRLEDLEGESDEEDEVEKVMRWAMDAARLDVATAGSGASNADHKEEEDKSSNAEDKEEEEKSSASSEEDEEESLELKEEKKRKEIMSKKNKAKSRWFFF
ncbi:nucleolin [Triticum aestivum]|nr:nucleolin-like [Triticum aestivum]